jgi:hypothetical protein
MEKLIERLLVMLRQKSKEYVPSTYENVPSSAASTDDKLPGSAMHGRKRRSNTWGYNSSGTESCADSAAEIHSNDQSMKPDSSADDEHLESAMPSRKRRGLLQNT